MSFWVVTITLIWAASPSQVLPEEVVVAPGTLPKNVTVPSAGVLSVVAPVAATASSPDVLQSLCNQSGFVAAS